MNSRNQTPIDNRFQSMCPGKHAKCVEFMRTKDEVLLRDSKTGVVQHYDHEEWETFITGVKEGKADLK